MLVDPVFYGGGTNAALTMAPKGGNYSISPDWQFRTSLNANSSGDTSGRVFVSQSTGLHLRTRDLALGSFSYWFVLDKAVGNVWAKNYALATFDANGVPTANTALDGKLLTTSGGALADSGYSAASLPVSTATQTALNLKIGMDTRFGPDNPRPYGWPMTAANALDDEFDATLAGWTWAPSAPTISYAYPGLINYNGASTWRFAKRTTPAISWAGDFDFAVAFNENRHALNTGYLQYGAMLLDGTNGLCIYIVPASYSSVNIHFANVTDGAPPTIGADVASVTFYTGAPKYQRMVRTGSDVNAYVSDDTISWRLMGTKASYSATVTSAGWVSYSTTSSADRVVLDWFRVAAP